MVDILWELSDQSNKDYSGSKTWMAWPVFYSIATNIVEEKKSINDLWIIKN